MPPGRFDPERRHAAHRARAGDGIGGVPTVMWRIVESPALDGVRPVVGQRASYGGAPPHPSSSSGSSRRSRTCARRCRPRTGSPSPRRSRPRTAATTTSRTRARSAGRRRPSSSIVSDDGATCPAGERGEVWIKGPTVMNRGYWRRPGRERGRAHRRLVAHRRRRLPRPRRLPVPRRPGEGHDHPRRRERVLRRGGERAVRPPRRDRRRGRGRAAPHARRGGEGGRAAARRVDGVGDGHPSVLSRRTWPISRCPSTSSCATSRCRATRRARC